MTDAEPLDQRAPSAVARRYHPDIRETLAIGRLEGRAPTSTKEPERRRTYDAALLHHPKWDWLAGVIAMISLGLEQIEHAPFFFGRCRGSAVGEVELTARSVMGGRSFRSISPPRTSPSAASGELGKWARVRGTGDGLRASLCRSSGAGSARAPGSASVMPPAPAPLVEVSVSILAPAVRPHLRMLGILNCLGAIGLLPGWRQSCSRSAPGHSVMNLARMARESPHALGVFAAVSGWER